MRIIGVEVLVCLFCSPHSKLVNRFLPNAANKMVFLAIATTLTLDWALVGKHIVTMGHSTTGWFTIALAVLCGIRMCRYIVAWSVARTSCSVMPTQTDSEPTSA